MILVFAACGIIAFKQLEVSDWGALQALWTESIAFAQAGKGQTTMARALKGAHKQAPPRRPSMG